MADDESSGAPPATSQAPAVSDKNKQLGVLCHLVGTIGFLTAGLTFFVPLVIWLRKRRKSTFVARQAKEAVNFQLNIFVWTVVTLGPPLAAWYLSPQIAGYLMFAPALVLIYGGLMSFHAGRMADLGEFYRYPGTFRLFR
jgi:hypothetical protein